ncbi:trypsin-like serine peptidase [Nonomuraea sp. NPDC003754]
MKRILLPAGGAILATGLLAAGLAGTASATPAPTDEYLAKSAEQVADIINFWTKSDNAALKSATAYHWDYKEVKKLVTKGGYTADTKPGVVAPIGEEKKVAAKVHNVNVPKTIGKVFFEGRDGKLYWCSGTSIQANYKNLVSTAGHCVYDIAGNDEVVSRWVFVPGYYQGKAPWGIYVGKQAFTHYDLAVYEDYDRDYAFVTVYNGIGGTANIEKTVTEDEYKAYKGVKSADKVEISKADYDKGRLDPKTEHLYSSELGSEKEKTGPDYPGAVVEQVEVTKDAYTAAGVGKGNGNKFGEPVVEVVTDKEAEEYANSKKGINGAKYPAEVAKDAAGNWTITHYYVQQWYKPGKETKYFKTVFKILVHDFKDLGRLGDNVGGQGFAYNQPTGQVVRTWGYPYAEHPDGSKPYTGVTPKWCYGKTSAKLQGSAAKKIEEHLALKCPVTPGYDGGPWLLKYSNAKRLGYVNGVTSTFNDQDGNDRVDYISSPYFDGETATVYKAAANTASGAMFPFPKP